MKPEPFQLKPGQAILEHCGKKFQVRFILLNCRKETTGPIGWVEGKKVLRALATDDDFECFNVKKTGKIIKLSKP